MQDRIERVVTLPVSIDRAWRAITDPSELARWFCQALEGDLHPGGYAQFRWEDEISRIIVTVVEPPRRFAYRWNPGAGEDHSVPIDDLPLTLVEFNLDEVEGGTRLTLIESGFASLPDSVRESAWNDNSGGWDEELGHLVAYTGKLQLDITS